MMNRWQVLGAATLVVSALCCAPATAQWNGGGPEGGGRERPSAEEMARRQAEARARLFEAIHADSSQRLVIDSLLAVQDSTRRSMMEEMRASFGDREAMQEMRQEMQALMADTDQQIVALLTEEQQAFYKAFREKEAENRGFGRRPRGDDEGRRDGQAPPPPATPPGDGG